MARKVDFELTWPSAWKNSNSLVSMSGTPGAVMVVWPVVVSGAVIAWVTANFGVASAGVAALASVSASGITPSPGRLIPFRIGLQAVVTGQGAGSPGLQIMK